MNKESFIQFLTDKRYNYELIDDHINIVNQGSVYLRSLTSLPEGVQFNNQGYVDLSHGLARKMYGLKPISLNLGLDTIYYLGDDKIKIGCIINSIPQWLDSYQAIGLKNNYHDDMITKYGDAIKEIAQWYNSKINSITQ